VKELPGIVVDDDQAELTGKWAKGQGLEGFIGGGYRYSSQPDAVARFRFAAKDAGTYDVRVSWQPHENRNTATDVSLVTPDGAQDVKLDQTKAPASKGFQSLGKVKLNAGDEAVVVFRTGGKGNVHIDAVQALKAD
jgi:hypothetical protein